LAHEGPVFICGKFALRAAWVISAASLVAQACSSDEAIAPIGVWGGPRDASAAGSGGTGGSGATGGSGGSGGTGGAATSGGSGGVTGGAAGTAGASGSAGTAGASGAGGTTDGSAGAGGNGGVTDGAAGSADSADAHRIDATLVDIVSDADGGGTDSGSGSPDATGDGATSRPPCMKSANQVVVLGDSYVNWISHTFPADLAKESGVTYRMYAVGGTAMGSGGIGLIPPQFDQAVAADPNIIAVIMDGGGNDILVPDTAQFPQGADCKQNAMSPMIPDCQKIVQKAVDKSLELMNTAAEKGVKDVVFFSYPHVPDGTLVGGAHPNAILDYALPMVKATCDAARVRTGGRLTCHFLDLVPVFDMHPEYFAFTDIHPNPTGSQAMAKAVWALMKDACIAQPASSGCCEP
jgi:GDSL-like Lipase/Acylhydrolase family